MAMPGHFPLVTSAPLEVLMGLNTCLLNLRPSVLCVNRGDQRWWRRVSKASRMCSHKWTQVKQPRFDSLQYTQYFCRLEFRRTFNAQRCKLGHQLDSLDSQSLEEPNQIQSAISLASVPDFQQLQSDII
jgi:hypothetical protein